MRETSTIDNLSCKTQGCAKKYQNNKKPLPIKKLLKDQLSDTTLKTVFSVLTSDDALQHEDTNTVLYL